ncbi:MAG: hypothetical protein WD887_03020 [Candidatus Saccharimonadales bacterium]
MAALINDKLERGFGLLSASFKKYEQSSQSPAQQKGIEGNLKVSAWDLPQYEELHHIF